VTPARKPFAGATLDSDQELTGGEFRGGETDLLVQVEEKMPFSVLGGFENTGNELTGDERLLAGFTYYDMWNLDHRFSYFFLSANQIQDFSAHTVSYEMPFRWRKDQMHHRLSMQGSVVLSDIVPEHNDPDGIDIEGTSYLASVRYTVPFAGIYEEVDLNAKTTSTGKTTSATNKDGSVNKNFTASTTSTETVVPGGSELRDLVRRVFRHEMYAGYDFKRTDNAVEFGIPQALEFKTDINQFALGYMLREENLLWRGGRTIFNIEGYYNPGGLSKYDTQEDYEGSRLGADNEYYYGKLNFEREETLPAKFKFRVRSAAQIASTRLLYSEQLGLGGAYSVRGFEERVALADNGVLVSAELETPRISFGSVGWGRYNVNRLLGVESIDRKKGLLAEDNGLSFLGFFDYGWGEFNDPLEDEPGDFSIAGAGIGLRYVMAPFLTIRADYGWQVMADGVSEEENDIDGRGHIGIYVRY
jgi:hemolysin activation/secretion protein